MRINGLTLSIVTLAVISPNLSFGRSLGQSGGKLIKFEKVWDGEIKLELRQQAPPTGEGMTLPWRELLRALRRLEAQGEIRGGRFVVGVAGEQFTLNDAVSALLEDALGKSARSDQLPI